MRLGGVLRCFLDVLGVEISVRDRTECRNAGLLIGDEAVCLPAQDQSFDTLRHIGCQCRCDLIARMKAENVRAVDL